LVAMNLSVLLGRVHRCPRYGFIPGVLDFAFLPKLRIEEATSKTV
jgi:hypothetical protein